ncbi:MAG: hypothetical protein Q9219_001373 [cf. Caloplaca sp. 3 TL-2023]
MGISVPEEELDLCHRLANTAYLNLGLTNDLFSWQKECESAKALGQDHVVNVISVLMEEHNISEGQAKALCKEKIKITILDFRKTVKDTNERTDVSVDLKRYLEGLLYSLSGNLVWSFDCPRYHSWSSFNERQLNLMKNGVPKSDRVSAKGAAIHEKGSFEPKTTKADTIPGVFLSSMPEHASGLDALPALSDDKSSSNGVVDTSLINVFVAKRNDGLDAMKLQDKSIAPSAGGDIYHDGVFRHDVEDLDAKVVQIPYEYLSSLPSKGVRERAIDAMNVWCHVPAPKLERIKAITTMLHNASLMLDDVEDGSQMRRGKPSTHTLFGAAQTVNSANYQIIRALEEVHKLGDVESLTVFTEEMKSLYVGQSLDLYWTSNLVCPSVDQYFKMIAGKTGGLFRLFGRLMAVHSANPIKIGLGGLLSDLGCYFQTRDDYQNLVSAEYTQQKGFCEDLDEGKYSLPIIHLILSMPSNHLLRNILTQRRVNGRSSLAHKRILLDMMKNEGSLEFTVGMLGELRTKVEKSITNLEKRFGVENRELRLLDKEFASPDLSSVADLQEGLSPTCLETRLVEDS